MTRTAIITHSRDSLATVQEYLPSNYKATADEQGNITISGEDNAGWTLDGYVIPRLASGLIFAKEVRRLTVEQLRKARQMAVQDYEIRHLLRSYEFGGLDDDGFALLLEEIGEPA